MIPVRPKTYNEILLYKRCLSMKTMVPDMDEAMFHKLYAFMSQSPQNSARILDNTLSFYQADQVVDSIPLAAKLSILSLSLTAAGLHIERPIRTSGDGDGGASGNNNNNNNNNNNA